MSPAFQAIVSYASVQMLMVFQPPKGKIGSIDPEGLYTPGMIADIMAEGKSKKSRLRCRQKMRRIMFKQFPKEPDGKIEDDFPVPLDAWFGWRWIQALH